MNISGTALSQISLSDIEKLYNSMKTPTQEQKEKAWTEMDKGIYDSKGNLIGDKYLEEDIYA